MPGWGALLQQGAQNPGCVSWWVPPGWRALHAVSDLGRFGTKDALTCWVWGMREQLSKASRDLGDASEQPVCWGWSLHSDPGYHRCEGGIWEFPKSLILLSLTKVSLFVPMPCWGGISHQSQHIPELSPCLAFQGKSNTALEDFRSSTNPKPTTTPQPVSSLWALPSPLTGRGLPSSCFPWGIPDPQP